MFLTWTTVTFAGLVLLVWGSSAFDAIRKKKKDAMDWFVLGVFLGFLGAIGDNLYWSIPWSLEFIDHPQADFFMSHGVFPNTIFRQGLGTIAAYCHIRSAIEYGVSNKILPGLNKGFLFFCIFGGLLYLLILLGLKEGLILLK